jgi:DNA-binding protein H-NS
LEASRVSSWHQQLEDKDMRKPRDYGAELKSLEDKAQELKTRKVLGLGELVIATGADALAPEELAGALILLAETTDPTKRKAWAKRGAAMFRQRSRRPASATDRDAGRAQPQPGRPQPPSGNNGPA